VALTATAPRAAPPADALLRALAPVVLGWCRRLGAGRVDPEEAAQEVLLLVATKGGGLDDPEKLRAWAFSVTRNVLLNHRRRAWWRRWTGEPAPSLAAAGNPEESLEDRQLAQLVDLALARLPDLQREVVVLRLVEERPDSEVASLLGVSTGTVKSRLRLGRERFKQIVDEDPRLAALRRFVEVESV